MVSGMGRLYGTSETRSATGIQEELGDAASRGPRNRHSLPLRDRSVETPQTRYETFGRPRGRRGVSRRGDIASILPYLQRRDPREEVRRRGWVPNPG